MTSSSYFVFLCIAVFMHENFPRIKAEYNRVHEGLQRTSRLPARDVLSEDIISQNKWKDRAPGNDYIRDIQAPIPVRNGGPLSVDHVLPYLRFVFTNVLVITTPVSGWATRKSSGSGLRGDRAWEPHFSYAGGYPQVDFAPVNFRVAGHGKTIVWHKSD
jgi:hypothetical protein